MKTDYTHIVILLDRTGSMESIRDDTIGGFNAFLRDQKAQPGRATLTLVQFDSQDPYEVVCRCRAVGEVPNLDRRTYVPRASTPLLDAMGRAINDLEQSLGAMAESDRPAKVVVVVVTDGQENASREFRKDQIERMVKAKTDKLGWQFVFLSADLAAIGDAMGVGISQDRVLLFEKNSDGNAKAWSSLSRRSSAYRSSPDVGMAFDATDRHHPDDPAGKR